MRAYLTGSRSGVSRCSSASPILTAARHIYASAGYRRVAEEPHHAFGFDLVAETWELTL